MPPCPGCAGCAGVAGVEEWSRPSGVPVVRCVQEWCGHAFGFPDRHPAPFGVAGVPCPVPVARPLVGWVGSRAGAWWFENWIVDASNAGFFVLLALSRFRQASFLESGFEIDRFVIIFYSVMICRLAFEAIIGFFGACAALKGVWWMPWQTVPMKDV